MSRRIRRATVLLLLFLLCSLGFASESSGPVPRRQKRGLMKMMMHIMWDPVRLIRYWYAYDVTKEIAKSWRKILPTMMLLPFNPNIADTPGIAKYVHPTHGLGATKYHKNTKQFAYPAAVASGETFSASQFQKDYLISDPSLKNAFSQFSPGSGVVFEGSHKQQSESSSVDSAPFVFRQYMGQQLGSEGSRNVHISSFPVIAKEVEGSNEQRHHIIFKPVPAESMFHGDSGSSIQTSDSQEIAFSGEMKPLPFPYKIDFPDSSREQQVIFKAMPMPVGGIHDVSKEKLEGDVVPSSTNSDSKRTKSKYFKYPSEYASENHRYQPVHPNSHVKYEDDDEKDGHAPPPQHVIHTGHQELHIVLHPIPIPLNFNASGSSSGGYPFMFPAGVGQSHQRQSSSPPGYDEEFYPSNNNTGKADKSNYSHEDGDGSSSERSDSKSKVTWVLKQDSSKTDRRTDKKPFDNVSDGSAPRITSVNFVDGKNHDRSPLTLNGETLDLVQLKEDLRHGTPVLIPFHKKPTFSSPQSDENANLNSPGNYGDILSDKSKEVMQASGENVFVQSGLGEQYGERNSTQRLIFFFKRP